MVIALADIILFVTAFVSLTYGTRIAWQFGRICKYKNDGKNLSEKIMGYIPMATLVYFIGFAIISKYLYKLLFAKDFEEIETLPFILIPLICSMITSCVIAWIALPKSKKTYRGNKGSETIKELAEEH